MGGGDAAAGGWRLGAPLERRQGPLAVDGEVEVEVEGRGASMAKDATPSLVSPCSMLACSRGNRPDRP